MNANRIDIESRILDKKRKSRVMWIMCYTELDSCTFSRDKYVQSPQFNFFRSCWHLRFYPKQSEDTFIVCLACDDIVNKDFPLTLRIHIRIWYKEYQYRKISTDYTFDQKNKYCKVTYKDPISGWISYVLRSRLYPLLMKIPIVKIECNVYEKHPQTYDMSPFCTRRFYDEFEELCMKKRRSDVILQVGNRKPYKVFPAHKIILKARSPMLKSMFTGNTKENMENIFHCVGYDELTVRNFLIFLYTGKLKICSSYESAVNLYRMADQYLVEDLKIPCRQFIKQYMNTSRFCNILRLANLHDDLLLKEYAKIFVKSEDNSRRIFPSRAWVKFRVKNALLAKEIVAASQIEQNKPAR